MRDDLRLSGGRGDVEVEDLRRVEVDRVEALARAVDDLQTLPVLHGQVDEKRMFLKIIIINIIIAVSSNFKTLKGNLLFKFEL